MCVRSGSALRLGLGRTGLVCAVSVGGELSHEVRLRPCSKEDEKEEEREGEKRET